MNNSAAGAVKNITPTCVEVAGLVVVKDNKKVWGKNKNRFREKYGNKKISAML